MKKCPYCEETIIKDAVLCRFCGRDIAKSEPGFRSIFFCPICKTEDSYCDSTNRVFCPHCREYVKRDIHIVPQQK